MNLSELVEEYERRRAEAARHGARVPMAKVYSIILEELRQLDSRDRPTRMMTTAEAAEVLGVARKTTARWAAQGRFSNARKTSNEGGEWRIPAADVYQEVGSEPQEESVPRLWHPDAD